MTHPGIAELAEQLRLKPALVLSGAGISTDSGIPDYRSPEALARPREPMRFQAFRDSAEARRHYWARSHVGFSRMRAVKPNQGHRAVATLQEHGLVTSVLTQNVDGLHQRAGSTGVLELHGSLERVRCLQCGESEPMAYFQQRLQVLNPGFAAQEAALNPDGDTMLEPEQTADFKVAACLDCGGVLKTDVVFFGENVPAPVVERAWQMLERSRSLLVLGSSLAVRSGLRFAEGAERQGKPVFIINDGPTRADEMATLKIPGRLAQVLTALLGELDLPLPGVHGRAGS